jgi:membrane-bound lytic murein transglycosylase MltF
MKRQFGLTLWSAVLFYFATLALASPVAAQPAQDKLLENAIIELAQKPWKGDLDGIVKRGFLRMLTIYNPLFFSYNGLEQRGLATEIAREFAKHLRKKLGKQAQHLNVVPIVVPRDELIPGLLAGRGDIIAANLTITSEREKLVAFSRPTFPDVSELVVTGPAAPPVDSFDDLVSVGLHVRRSSSYFEHLSRVNEQRIEAGKKAIPIDPADERLEDYDLLEMVNAAIIPAVILDSHKAKIWAKVFKNIRIHNDLTVNKGGNIAWAMRKENPKLLSAANDFRKVMRKGSLLGNVLLKRYLNTDWIDNVTAPQTRKRFQSVSKLMKKYADRYGFDWLMVAAQGYQESKLDQSKRSPAGAVGIMQLLPTTAADPKVAIQDIHLTEPNIHAGVRYLKLLRENYFNDGAISALDRVLLSFGAYNAGPGNIARARAWAKKMGLDPNRWFGHVEVAAARTISREPVVYVRNIFKYYVTYKKLEQATEAREAAKEVGKK